MNKVVLAASLAFAITFTLNACSSSDDKDSNDNGSNNNAEDYCDYYYGYYYCDDLRPSSSSLRPSSSSVGNVSGTFTDSRNNSTYKWVKIGNQIWMARNLDYNASGSKCYDNKAQNCDKYGRLYTWATAMALPATCNSSTCSGRINTNHQGICPSGWHIPSDNEWDELKYYVGSTMVGWHLKATSGWGDYDYGGGDTFGFSALPGGSGISADNKYYKAGEGGHWWNHSEADSKNAHSRALGYNTDRFYSNDVEDKTLPFSIRCVKD